MVERERGPKNVPINSRPLNDVEREIVLADIAYLKQKEIESGDWAKWEHDQEPMKGYKSIIRRSNLTGNSFGHLGIFSNINNLVRDLGPGLIVSVTLTIDGVEIPVPFTEWEPITDTMFIEATGRAPTLDDMSRANCEDAGKPGHHFCGWCHVHNKPRWMCEH
jgi:hypothetical protein